MNLRGCIKMLDSNKHWVSNAFLQNGSKICFYSNCYFNACIV